MQTEQEFKAAIEHIEETYREVLELAIEHNDKLVAQVESMHNRMIEVNKLMENIIRQSAIDAQVKRKWWYKLFS